MNIEESFKKKKQKKKRNRKKAHFLIYFSGALCIPLTQSQKIKHKVIFIKN